LLNNVFFPRVALQVVRALEIDGKIDVTLPENARLNPKHLVASYLPHTSSDETLKYGCRSELSAYLAVCHTFWKHYSNLASPELRFGASEGLETIDKSRSPVRDKKSNVLIPTFIVHCHNSRFVQRHVASPISIFYGGRFGEFAMVEFESEGDVREDYKLLEKDLDSISSSDSIVDKGVGYYCVLKFYPKTTPGRRSARRNTMVISFSRDLGFDRSVVDEAFNRGYNSTGN